MQVCTSLQTDNHASTPPLSFLQTGCPSCRPTNSVKALKAQALKAHQNGNKGMKLAESKSSKLISLAVSGEGQKWHVICKKCPFAILL